MLPQINSVAKTHQARYLLINQVDTALNSNTEKRSLIFSYVLLDLNTNQVLTTATYSSSLASYNGILQTLIQTSQSIPSVLKQFTLN